MLQGRFEAILVDEDNYLLELARYVVLNLVRSGGVKEVKDWPLNSYRAMHTCHSQTTQGWDHPTIAI